MHPNSLASPTKNGILSAKSPSPSSPNGVDENRLGVRSPSTTRMITTLQKEMDTLKTSSEAARAAAGNPISDISDHRCGKSKS
jgi:hypothetical protein